MSDVSLLRITGVVGAGTMGVGIAALHLSAGRAVILVDPDSAVREKARRGIGAILGDRARAAAMGGLTIAADATVLSGAELVIEAVPEVLPLKHAIYRQLFDVVGPHCVVASNTSSIPPDQLAQHLSDGEAGRFAIAHYWHPPHCLPLVEIVPGKRTEAATIRRLRTVIAETGSHPVTLARAVPGFIGNRIQFAVLREALHLLESGVADAATIDEVVRFSLGRRYAVSGPIEAADLGGLQTFQQIAALLLPKLAHGMEGLAALTAHVEAGEFGAATGQGFYAWPKQRRAEVAARQSAFDTGVPAFPLSRPGEAEDGES